MPVTRHGPALVRMSCERHLGEFEQPSPQLGDLVWCWKCSDYRRVTLVIVASHKGGEMCGKRARWVVAGTQVVEVVCTEPPGHSPDQHYDRTFSAFFPDSAGKPRPARAPGRALARHREGELVFTAL